MAIYEDPYFVTADPYGGVGGEEFEEAEEAEEAEEDIGDVTEALREVEDFGDVQQDEEPQPEDAEVEETYAYAEGEEEEDFYQEEAEILMDPVEDSVEQEAVGEAEYLDDALPAEDAVGAEAELLDQPADAEAEALEGYEEEGELLLDFPAEVEPCSPGLDVQEDEDEGGGLGFHEALEEVDYTPQDDEADDDGAESDEEPSWLRNVGVLDPKVAEDADVSAAFLDGLTGSETDLDLAFPQYVPCLARYLVGHPEALVTKKKKGHKKGAGKRYFGGEDRSEDVMADKVVTGCWACGKLDHESQDCIFKRCFVCSEQGHEVSECRKRSISCKRCFRQGHFSDLCPLDEYETFDNEDDMSFCRCMKCGEEGHLNCGTMPQMEFVEAWQAGQHQAWQRHEQNGRVYEEQPRNDWSPQREVWGHGGWDGWQQKETHMVNAAWMFQAGMSPLPVGVVDWAPPAGDGGGYNQSYESYESYDRGYGGGNRWVRTGNSKGWGGGNPWNGGGGWGRQGSWDQGGWGSWDGSPPNKRRRR